MNTTDPASLPGRPLPLPSPFRRIARRQPGDAKLQSLVGIRRWTKGNASRQPRRERRTPKGDARRKAAPRRFGVAEVPESERHTARARRREGTRTDQRGTSCSGLDAAQEGTETQRPSGPRIVTAMRKPTSNRRRRGKTIEARFDARKFGESHTPWIADIHGKPRSPRQSCPATEGKCAVPEYRTENVVNVSKSACKKRESPVFAGHLPILIGKKRPCDAERDRSVR
jgi:hypothetical protein